jgi:hypothetical protein
VEFIKINRRADLAKIWTNQGTDVLRVTIGECRNELEVVAMAQTLGTLPVASTALLSGVTFQMLLRRACALLCEYEDNNDDIVSLELLFDGVESFRCTYMGACTVEMIRTAYGKVVDIGSTEWLTVIRDRLVNSGYGSQNIEEVKHLMIYFEDGPCYEFICRSFRVEESAKGKGHGSR